ncbi:MAG TPA: hypothetical protein VF219_14065 [Vicinamibacterales bacterium]
MRRFCILSALLVFAIGGTAAQAPNPRDVRLVGDRFRPLTWDEMTPPQRAMIEHLLAGERGTTSGPFNVFLRSPEMGDVAQQLGAQIRFHSSLQRRLNEMAILIVARHMTAQYEWYAHKRLALQAGLAQEIVDAIGAGKRPASLQADEQALYAFEIELLERHEVSDATFKAAATAFGERGIVDLIGLMGYYHIVSMALNVDRYPLPDGARPELQAVTRAGTPERR